MRYVDYIHYNPVNLKVVSGFWISIIQCYFTEGVYP